MKHLQHVIERAVILSQGPQLEVGDWLPNVSATPRSSRLATLADREQEYIMEVLAQTGWRVSGEGGRLSCWD